MSAAAVWRGVGVGALVVLAALLLHVGLGSHLWIAPWDVAREIFHGATGEGATNAVVWQLRLPRAICCALVGIALGGVGAAFQALFRNPLAEPFVIGVSSGAAMGGVVALAAGFGAWLGGFGLMLAAFLGGMGSLALVQLLAQRRGTVQVTTLLLAGVVVSALLSALLTLVLLLSGMDANRVLRWLLGSTTEAQWPQLGWLLLAVGVGLTALALQTRRLNAFAVGEASAQRLGVETGRLRRVVVAAGTAAVAASVGAAGVIGFVGLVAPHIARRVVGNDLRRALPASAVAGALVVLLTDLVAQRAMTGGELPVGAITALLGAPALLVLLRRD